MSSNHHILKPGTDPGTPCQASTMATPPSLHSTQHSTAPQRGALLDTFQFRLDLSCATATCLRRPAISLMSPHPRHVLALAAIIVLVSCGTATATRPHPDSTFRAAAAQLSFVGGWNLTAAQNQVRSCGCGGYQPVTLCQAWDLTSDLRHRIDGCGQGCCTRDRES